jgi:GMP synthase (glutamine-hydrolysing)
MAAPPRPTNPNALDLHTPSLVVPANCVAILDAGAQYSKVIDRRVRELQVEAHILKLDTPIEQLQAYAAIIISGGPQSVYGSDAPAYDPRLFTEYRKPILGICYGMQLINHAMGGKITRGGTREDGQFHIQLTDVKSKLYAGFEQDVEVLLTHGDSVTTLADGFVTSAVSPSGICASIEHAEKKLYGVQYHPEVDLTPRGNQILQNFLEGICQLPRTFTLQSRKHAAIAEIRGIVGEKSKVLCLLSGGVDSSVCAALLKEAIGAERVSRRAAASCLSAACRSC